VVLAGNSSYSDKYVEALKRKIGSNDNIIFTGFVDGELKNELFSNATFYVLPSESEGMPLTLLEALGHHVVCIASDIPGNKLWDENTYYFQAKNSDDLAKTIMKAFKERKKFTREGFSLFSWETVFSKTELLYKAA
jgi:glycosyltransferase involved in cell wall biosynthesis